MKFDNRQIEDYLSTLGPNLILIADKPCSTDKQKIFESVEASQYLDNCFTSNFKSATTHITFIGEEDTSNFARNVLLSILEYYTQRKTLDCSKLLLGFVGKDALNAFIKDYMSHPDESTLKSVYFDGKRPGFESAGIIKVYDSDVSSDDLYLPYVVLPALTDTTTNPKDILEKTALNEQLADSPYCTTKQIIHRLNLIKQLFDEGSLKYLRFNASLKQRDNRTIIDYFKVYDRYTNNELLYCYKDIICKDDTSALKNEFIQTLKEVLTTVPLHGDNIEQVISLFSYKDQIKVLTQSELEEKPITRESFILTGGDDRFGDSVSSWYDKWDKNVYIPELKSVITSQEKAAEGYDKHHIRHEWIFDIEVFKHDWLFVAKTADKKHKLVCWNCADKLKEWVKDKILIGFNNAGYDNAVIKHAMMFPNYVDGTMTVKEFSDTLIHNGSVPEEKKFVIRDDVKDRSAPHFISWDISFHMPFDIRRNSLKKLTMSTLNKKNYDSTVPFDKEDPLTKFEREEVERYCEMDVDNTIDLFLPDPADVEAQKTDPSHKMREYAKDSYDIRWNLIIEYKMTPKTLINKSSSFAGKLLCGEKSKPNIRNTYKEVDGKIQFYKIPDLAMKELAGTSILDFYIKNQDNPDYIKEKMEYYLGEQDEDHKYQFGFGGLHQAKLNYSSQNLVNMDVASLYPSLLVAYGLMSRGAVQHPESYEEVYHTRLKAKKEKKKLLNEGLKLILNGAIGAMLSEFNPLFDTWSNSSICVHGQLLLFILVKRLYDAGFNIVQTNTDGIMIEKQDTVDFMPICEKWMQETKLVLEFDDIAILQQNNVNNYYCEFTNGKIKNKGFYLSNEKFGKATSKILCNIVTNKPPLEGLQPRDYVIYKKHSIGEIYDAVTNTKLEGRSLAFVVGYPEDKKAQAYYSRSKNARQVAKKDEKGKVILDENGEQVMETVHTISKITGFTDHMVLIDDVADIDINEVNTQEYINFAKNLLNRIEDFGPYYTEKFLKVEEPAVLQALNPLKDNTDPYPTKAGVVCQNFLFECDYLTKEEQLEIIEKCKDKLYRVVWSGNKSFHCVVRLDKPVTSTTYKKIWYYLQHRLGFMGADEQSNQPSKYTRTPGQINPKTGEEQTLYSFDKNILSLDKIMEDIPVVKDELKPCKDYTGKVTMEALKKHINKQDWSEGNRFASVQKLSPRLIAQVSMEELIAMIPVPLEKDHRYVLRAKYHYYEKYIKPLENQQLEELLKK